MGRLATDCSATYDACRRCRPRARLEGEEVEGGTGFRDSTGTYLTETGHTGVWLSSVPLEEAARFDVLLAVDISSELVEPYEWVEEDFSSWISTPPETSDSRAPWGGAPSSHAAGLNLRAPDPPAYDVVADAAIHDHRRPRWAANVTRFDCTAARIGSSIGPTAPGLPATAMFSVS